MTQLIQWVFGVNLSNVQRIWQTLMHICTILAAEIAQQEGACLRGQLDVCRGLGDLEGMKVDAAAQRVVEGDTVSPGTKQENAPSSVRQAVAEFLLL